MKTGKLFLSFLVCLFFTFFIQAQEGPKINPEELADNQLNALSKDIPDLDDFQKLELRDFLIESTTTVKNAMDNGTNSVNLNFLIENTSRDFDNKLKEVLLPEQFESYMELRRSKAAEGTVKKKNKKKKAKERE